MKLILCGVASFAVTAAFATHAAVTSVGPAASDLSSGPGVGPPPLWSLELPFTVDLTSAGTTVPWAGANWSVTITDGALGPFHSVVVEAYHLVGPHGGEAAPGLPFLGGVLFPSVAALGGTSFGTLPHVGASHSDQWELMVIVDPGGTTASGVVRGFHPGIVPEPGSFTFVAGLGLIAFAGYRRVRA